VTPDAWKEHDRAREQTMKLGGTFPDEREQKEPIHVSLDDILQLLPLLPYDLTDEDTWDPRAIRGVLQSNVSRFGNRALLYCRKIDRTRFRQGALSGDELTRLRGAGLPVLCVFLNHGRKYEITRGRGDRYDHDFVFPSLVLPDNEAMPSYVFNVSG
jgi:hypothetical protein